MCPHVAPGTADARVAVDAPKETLREPVGERRSPRAGPRRLAVHTPDLAVASSPVQRAEETIERVPPGGRGDGALLVRRRSRAAANRGGAVPTGTAPLSIAKGGCADFTKGVRGFHGDPRPVASLGDDVVVVRLGGILQRRERRGPFERLLIRQLRVVVAAMPTTVPPTVSAARSSSATRSRYQGGAGGRGGGERGGFGGVGGVGGVGGGDGGGGFLSSLHRWTNHGGGEGSAGVGVSTLREGAGGDDDGGPIGGDAGTLSSGPGGPGGAPGVRIAHCSVNHGGGGDSAAAAGRRLGAAATAVEATGVAGGTATAAWAVEDSTGVATTVPAAVEGRAASAAAAAGLR